MEGLVIPKVPTLADLDIAKKKTFMRIDINVPIEPESGEILDDRRIREHAKRIKEVVERFSPALVLGSHQGRPGEHGFVTLERHAALLAKYSGLDVKFVGDVIGPEARRAMEALRPGEVLLLDNLRMASEEVMEGPMERQASTIFARRLAELCEAYVNDAFATAHRSQPSIVGLPLLLPSALGPLFEEELEAVKRALEAREGPRVYVLGGAKVHELMRVVENLVRNKLADRILTTGLVAQVFLAAKGANIGRANVELLNELGLTSLVARARHVLLRGAPIETPIDFKTVRDGEVRNEPLGSISGRIVDIGENTANIFSNMIREASVVVMKGPAGIVEEPAQREGTARLLEALLSGRAYGLIAGGQLASMVDPSRLGQRVHVTTGPNALLLLLSGEELPALKALELSAKMFLGWKL